MTVAHLPHAPRVSGVRRSSSLLAASSDRRMRLSELAASKEDERRTPLTRGAWGRWATVILGRLDCHRHYCGVAYHAILLRPACVLELANTSTGLRTGPAGC